MVCFIQDNAHGLVPSTIPRTALNLYVSNTSPHTVTLALQCQDGRETSLRTKLPPHLICYERIVVEVILIDPVFRIAWTGNIGVYMLRISAARIRSWSNRAKL